MNFHSRRSANTQREKQFRREGVDKRFPIILTTPTLSESTNTLHREVKPKRSYTVDEENNRELQTQMNSSSTVNNTTQREAQFWARVKDSSAGGVDESIVDDGVGRLSGWLRNTESQTAVCNGVWPPLLATG